MQESSHQCPQCGFDSPELAPKALCPRCTLSQALGRHGGSASPPPDIPGMIVHEEIGEGGFGVVYRATRQESVVRQVAVKVLKPGLDTREILRRFAVEQKALTLLKHPYIACIYDAGETEKGYPYFTMEYIEGVPLTEAFVDGEAAPILKTFLQVCQAIEYAHGRRIIHRDLKPSNILVTESGTPKIIDFGIAKATDGDATPGMTFFTGKETMLGTPEYMAPEQNRASGVSCDARTDLFALGKILKEMMQDKSSSRDLEAVITRSIAEAPEDRYPSVQKFANDLTLILNGRPIEHPKTSWWWSWKSVGAITLVVLLLTVLFFLRGQAPVEDFSQGAVITLADHAKGSRVLLDRKKEKGLMLFAGSGITALIDCQSGEKIGEVVNEESDARTGCFASDSRSFYISYRNGTLGHYSTKDCSSIGKVRRISSAKDYVTGVVSARLSVDKYDSLFTCSTDDTIKMWSHQGKLLWEEKLRQKVTAFQVNPDQKSVVAGHADGTITLINLLKRQVKILPGHSGKVTHFCHSGDGQFFASSSEDHTARVWSQDGSAVQVMVHADDPRGILLNHDGSLLFTACLDGPIRIWDVKAGKAQHSIRLGKRLYTFNLSPDGRFLAAGGTDRKVGLWSTETGEPVGRTFFIEKKIQRVRVAPLVGNSFQVIVLSCGNEIHFYPEESFRKKL